jgi:hypothetical protein
MTELQFVLTTIRDAVVEDSLGILLVVMFVWSVRWFAGRLAR